MSAVEIESLPYPARGASADGMLANLRLLRVWVLKYREEYNRAVGQEHIPIPKEPPGRIAYASLAVRPSSDISSTCDACERVGIARSGTGTVVVWDHCVLKLDPTGRTRFTISCSTAP